VLWNFFSIVIWNVGYLESKIIIIPRLKQTKKGIEENICKVTSLKYSFSTLSDGKVGITIHFLIMMMTKAESFVKVTIWEQTSPLPLLSLLT
jgi:hypothetical protein